MSTTVTSVDYYFTPQSPWTYLGHERFAQIARAAGAAVRVLPIDLGGKVFPISGGLPAQRLEQSYSQAVQERYEANTQQAIDAGVFGAPSYVIDGELFWGQDRLDFVERKLRAG